AVAGPGGRDDDHQSRTVRLWGVVQAAERRHAPRRLPADAVGEAIPDIADHLLATLATLSPAVHPIQRRQRLPPGSGVGEERQADAARWLPVQHGRGAAADRDAAAA